MPGMISFRCRTVQRGTMPHMSSKCNNVFEDDRYGIVAVGLKIDLTGNDLVGAIVVNIRNYNITAEYFDEVI